MARKIMLVDDMAIANFIMKKMLQKVAPECQVVDFTLPSKAIDSIEALSPDLIFLDLNMPGIDGWKFLNLMSQHNFDNKVYILTSSTTEFDRDQSKQYKNVISLLVKPVNLTALPELLKVLY